MLLASGCGGGAGPSPPKQQTLRGAAFVYAAPAGWRVTRDRVSVTAAPNPKAAAPLVQVSVFRLVHPYRPALWPRVVAELERDVPKLAASLEGTIASRRTISVGGLRAREYVIGYTHGKERLDQRLVFAFRGRSEYQLLCRWRAAGEEPAACGLLYESFSPS